VTSDPQPGPGPSAAGSPAPAGLSAPAAPASREAERQEIKRLAEEFEALLMTQMLREMRQSMLSEDEHQDGLGADVMTDTVDTELGRSLSRSGGFGLADVLLTALDRSLGRQPAAPVAPGPGFVVDAPTSLLGPALLPAPTAPTGPSAPTVSPGASLQAPAEADLTLPSGPLSSPFGWRRDPFTGVPQFHRGIDVALAYGQDVPAAADGQVVSAGNSGTYGLMVVTEDGAGRQVRYAHLSASSVRPGDAVTAGQAIGKVGSSGRSTGPHVHIEVLDQGHPIDPAGGS
jgi:murein DD-endopeptidase MepM/ murein hydrolase activator NlpD